MKKQSGIWLDLRNAYIVTLPPNGKKTPPEVTVIPSAIEESAPTGGSRSQTPWGPQGGDNERSAQERRHHEEKRYFEAIIHLIPVDTDELVIFGPSEAKHGLLNEIEKHKHFHPKVMGLESTDKMSEKQIVAWVNQYFKRPVKRILPKRV